MNEEIAWHALSKDDVLKELKSSEEGISDEEADVRLKKYGYNQLKKIRTNVPFLIFLKQFNSFLIYILLAAAIISTFLKNYLDSGVIFAIILLNSTLGFIQEYKAEKTIEKLRDMLVPSAKVLRNGKLRKIKADDIVPGDILIFDEGDKIMADARLISVTNLEVNEAVLTGESLSKEKHALELPLETALGDKANIIFKGTTIAKGFGKAVVTSTGMTTEFGKIAGLVQKVKSPETPLQKKLNIFAKKLGILVIILSVFITLIGIYYGFDKMQMFLMGVSLAVSAIPEGLPAVIAICLALSVQRMSKVNSLVRKLPAAETLGGTTVICTDKTGTLTEEKMAVRELYYNNKILISIDNQELLKQKAKESKELALLLKIGCLCNNVRVETAEDGKTKEIILGDPTEKALVESAEYAGIRKNELEKKEIYIKTFAFTSSRKMMSVIKERGITKISYVKGSPEVILERCTKELINGKAIELTKARKNIIMQVYKNMASKALRVLAFAFKEIRTPTQNMAETSLTFSGLQGMIDPPRKEVKEAIEKCKNAGIRVIMITGDSVLTAKAIATEIGIEGDVMSDIELEKLSEQELIDKLKDVSIFARVTPNHKLLIVNALKKKGEIVAVTGDGVNDVLALKKADIGIAMGIRGTDVARDTAEIVLLDDNFASIVNAIHEGRRSYTNIKKTTKFLLSVNFSEILLVLFSIMLKLPLPLLPLQILWMNLVTDSFPALALGAEPADKDVMQKKPRNPKESILARIMPFIIIGGIFVLVIEMIVFYMTYFNGIDIDKTRTMVLTTNILFELFFVFSCKSKKSVLNKDIFNNKWILYSLIIVIVLQCLAIYSPLSIAFKLVPLTLSDWIMTAGLGFIAFLVFEASKGLIEKMKIKEE